MQISSNLLKSDERAAFNLRGLYQKYGYIRYKMGKFEEYDLYMKNKEMCIRDSMVSGVPQLEGSAVHWLDERDTMPKAAQSAGGRSGPAV